MLSGGGDPGHDTRVRLGESLETLNELGKIVGVLDLDGDLHDGRDGELHHLHVVSLLEVEVEVRNKARKERTSVSKFRRVSSFVSLGKRKERENSQSRRW